MFKANEMKGAKFKVDGKEYTWALTPGRAVEMEGIVSGHKHTGTECRGRECHDQPKLCVGRGSYRPGRNDEHASVFYARRNKRGRRYQFQGWTMNKVEFKQNYLSASDLSKHIELRTEWASLANRNPFRLPSSGNIEFSLFLDWMKQFLRASEYEQN